MKIKELPRNVWVVTITSFLTDVSSEMIFNLIPLFLVNVLGVKTNIVGLIEGVAEATASLLKIVSGTISDRIGKRKSLAVLGYSLSAFSKPLLYFANSWGWVLFIRFSDRLGKGIRTAPRDSLLAGSINSENRGLAFGLHRAGDTAGAFVGLAIATWIIWVTQGNTNSLTQATFQTVVLISIVPGILAVFILALGAREISSGRGSGSRFLISFNNLDRRFKAFLLVIFLFTLGNSADAFIILRAQERGLTVLQVMGMLLTFNAVYFLLATPIGALSDRVGRRIILLIGWIIYGLVYIGFAIAHTGYQVWFIYALYGIYYAMTEGTARALVADLVPQERRGTAYGLFHGTVGIAALPASLIAGLLWQGIGGWAGFGPSAPFLFGAALSLTAGVLFAILVRDVPTQVSNKTSIT